MTEHFTRKEAVAMASTIAEDDDYEFNLVNAAVSAKLKEWEALGAVANHWIVPHYGFIFPTEEAAQRYQDNLGCADKPIACFAHALPAQPAEQPIKLYADSSNPDMFSRDLLDAAGNRYTIMTPSMCQFDIDASALRAAGLEMKIDGLDSAPDGSSRAKMYWQPIGYSERERVVIHNIELDGKARPDLMPQAVAAIEKMGFRAGPATPDALQSQAERINALEREIERLEQWHAEMADERNALASKCDTLRTELAAVRAQEVRGLPTGLQTPSSTASH